MKTKLHALIAEQKALTARFEELLKETTSVDIPKVYIKGHATRGAEVIKMLEDLGGINISNLKGSSEDVKYYILTNNIIIGAVDDCSNEVKEELTDYTELHLPKEEVELIEGEVYVTDHGCVFIHKDQHNKFFKDRNLAQHLCGININKKISIYDFTNKTHFGKISKINIATPEQRKQLFDALEKAGKHFDKENMRLLDVEEFTLKDGDPFICKVNGKLSVEVFAYYKEPFGVVSYNNYTCAPLFPFTDKTKHLTGTTDSPDKHYKFVHNED